MKSSTVRATACRCCDSKNLHLVHDFGEQPLAGRYPRQAEESAAVARFPLDLTQCLSCGLLQVTYLPPIGEIFNEEYCYSSSTVPDLVRHFAGYASYIHRLIGGNGRVFEFGSNDGVLLDALRTLGVEGVGIDASDNVARLARDKGLNVATGFLNAEFVINHDHVKSFDLVTCSNVFAHIHELREAVGAVRLLLRDAGYFCIEVHDGDSLIREGQFDTVYHEHLTYFTEESLRTFLESEGFAFVECPRTPMHGGCLRMCVRLVSRGPSLAVVGRQIVPLSDFVAPAVARCRSELARLCDRYGSLSGYGAAGRAQMFVNFTDSGSMFDEIFDDSQLRQGRHIAGTRIPINAYTEASRACCVVLAWNYADSISKRVRRDWQKIVTVIPEFKEW